MSARSLVKDKTGWTTISSTTHFADEHLQVVTDLVVTPSQSKPRPWIVVHRKPAVVIAPMTPDGKFLLVRQERIPIRSAIWEMPAGQIDHTIEPNESEVAEAALREMREETGHDLETGGQLIPLGYYFSSAGFTDEHGYFFLARPVTPCRDEVERDQSIIECRAFSAAELRRMIAENEIRDANTLSICARMVARGLLALEPSE